MVEGLIEDLQDFKSEVSETYVKTEEFEELLEQTLRRAAEERSPGKRRLYRAFLSNTVKSPGASYDNEVHLLRILEQVPPEGLKILAALARAPGGTTAPWGTALDTLRKRLPEIPASRIEEIFGHLQTMGLANLRSLKVMMTAHGAEDLRHAVTPLGMDLLRHIRRS